MTAVTVTPERARAARNADLVVFAVAGVTFAAWASRIADAKAILGLTPGELGATLLAISAGSLVAMPSAGRIIHRVGVVATVRAGTAFGLLGLLAVASGVDLAHSRLLVTLGLGLLGLGVGVWDVSMNLEGAAIERHLGVTVMPHFHAAFSAGTVVSALLGSVMSRWEVPFLAHLGTVGLLGVVGGVLATRSFLPRRVEEDEREAAPTRQEAPGSAWLEPRTLLIGFVTLVAAFTEGTANDWLSVAFVDGHHTPAWVGVLAFATFLTAMTAGRLVGTRLLDRHGRVPVLQATFVLAVLGSLLVVFAPTPLAFVGAALWGFGVSLGFPVGMSASADDPLRAPARMSVVTTIGYLAFIAGPPSLGWLGDHVGVLHALLVVGALVVPALLAVPAVREPGAHGIPEKNSADGEHGAEVGDR